MRKGFLLTAFLIMSLLEWLAPTSVHAQNTICDQATLILSTGNQVVTGTNQTEYWYHYVVPPGQNVDVTVTTTLPGTNIKAYTSNCLNLGAPVATGVSSVTATNIANSTGIFISFDFLGAPFNLGSFNFTTAPASAGLSDNAALSDLSISPGSIPFTFVTATYNVNVPFTNTIAVTPTLSDGNASIKINNVTATDEQPFNVAVTPGQLNVILVKVTAQNGTTQRTYTINATVAAGGGNTAPTGISLTPDNIDENSAVNTAVGFLSTTDADGGDIHTYSLVAGTGDTDNASFEIQTNIINELVIKVIPDFEIKNSYSVRVQTDDGNGGIFQRILTIAINDLVEGANSAPTGISLSATAINENVATNSTVGALSSTDANTGDTFTYTLIAGAGDTDNSAFNISGNSLKINNSPDFETKSSYSVRIKTTDQGGLAFEKIFTINVSNLNEAPTGIALSSATINENVAANSTVGTLTTTDPDNGNTFTYSLASGTGSTDNASFSISDNSLRITNSPDFETKNSYSVRIRTTDQDNLTFEKSFTISINNVNEAPTNLAISANSINENVAANSTVVTLTTTDPDNGNTFTYSLVAGAGDTDNAAFNISDNSLKINNSPDFETKNSYSVLIKTTDQEGLTFEKIFTISILNENEAPTNLAISANSINENVAANSTVGTLTTTDPDNGNTFTYSLVAGAGDTDNAAFNISGNSLKINNSPDFETKSSYSVRIKTTDQGGLSFEQQFTITILNVNEGEDPNAFITTWKPVEGKFTIPTATGSPYSYAVKVIDNTTKSTVHTSTNNTGNVTITGLDNAKIYTVEITGTFPRIYFLNAGNLGSQILTVKQWGKIVWASMEGAFSGCSNLTIPATDAPDLSLVTSMSQMFLFAAAFNQPIAHWDVSNVTNMSSMFDSAKAFNQPIGSWNVSNVTNMNYLFYSATAFNQPIGSWNVSKVTFMGYMFASATAFNQPIGSWNVSNVTNMRFLFYSATAFNQPIGSWVLNDNNIGLAATLDNCGLSVANYDATLIGWSNLTGPARSLEARGLKYCNGEAARNTLEGKGWFISGDVKDCSVNKSVQAITFSALSAKTFGDAKFAVAATASSGLPVEYTATPAGILTFETDPETGITTASIIGAGTVTITAKQPGNQNYNAAPDVTQTLTVNKAVQTITFNAITAFIEVGDPAFALGATSTSALPVLYSATPTGRITIDANGNATPVGGGNVEITASQAGNNNYIAATSVKQILCIAPVAPVIIVQTQSGKEVLTTAAAQTLSWFKDGTANSIATGSVFNPSSQPTALGVYYAKVDAGNGCLSKPSNKFTVSVIVGLEDLSQVASIWPNPTTDYLFVDNVSAKAFGKMVQLNGTELELPGQYTNNRLQLDVRALAPGVYVLKLVDGNNIKTARIVKN